MALHQELRYGNASDPFSVEYNRRKGHFSMSEDHMHKHYELYYLFGGERFYFIKDRVYRVRSGDLVFIPGNEVHKTSDTGVPNHERIVIYVNESYFEPLQPDEAELLLAPFHGPHRVVHLPDQDKLRIEQLLYEMLREIQEEAPGYRMAVRHAAGQALLFAARQSAAYKQGAPEDTVSPAAARMNAIASYISEHYREPLTLSGLSEQFYLSPSHLSRSFKKYTGFGLIEYIGITRIKEAQRLLRETDERIIRVSEDVGFENFSHFEKVFKSVTRMSARSYRSGFRRRE
ncbi:MULTISPECIES: AraC family transcriptional regulator [Paenibacillus]|uniref:AraC family transcriptional regulator n=2 Tax=Paenibacillus TaxID=44249 RepID=UPI000E2550B2|nr:MULTISPECIES: AraC family transcriptional regulator [Paenibacillus]MCM2998147.1 AraC family transcriptional regulator [Paenibacillus cellulositrophicus]RED40667.1 AraC-like DNA-binding protein [Paenibacillus sp. VMFN-D1]